MSTRLAFGRAILLAAIALGLLHTLQAQDAVIVQSQQSGGQTTYNLSNNSTNTDNPFYVAFFCVQTDGTTPVTPGPNWISENLTADNWNDAMTGGQHSGAYINWWGATGLTWEDAFPTLPDHVIGYFLDYDGSFRPSTALLTFDDGLVAPGNSLLGAFGHLGDPGTTFVAAGPVGTDPNQASVTFQHFAGEITAVPEPATLTLAALGLLSCAALRRSKKS